MTLIPERERAGWPGISESEHKHATIAFRLELPTPPAETRCSDEANSILNEQTNRKPERKRSIRVFQESSSKACISHVTQ